MENAKDSKKTIANWITAHKARFFILCGVLASIIILTLDYRNGFDWQGIQVEAHGMLFDVILFGIILSFYEAYMDKKRKEEDEERTKNERIQRYQEEIEDFLGWDEKEASYRIVRNIKRLYKEGVTNINLHRAFLSGADLCDFNLCGSNLEQAILEETILCRTNLKGVNLRMANLKGANLFEANLSGADLSFADLRGADLMKVEIIGSDLSKAKLDGAMVLDYPKNKESLLKAGAEISKVKFV